MLTRFCVIIAYWAALTVTAGAQDTPISLACTSNAKASRDYGFVEKQWSGAIPPDASKIFGISSRRQPNAGVLRDKVFLSLNTVTPVIRSITPPSEAAEFKGTIVSRSGDSVFIMWQNEYGNKIWLAVVDLTHKKATVSQVFQGMTSVGIEAETLDCK